MDFSYTQKRELESFAQKSVIMAPRGMVAASQPLAARTGCKILENGGNAVDAAVGMACTLGVVEPHSTGLGGDAFALLYLAKKKKIVGLNGSGRAPSRADLNYFHNLGLKTMPESGVLSVTVPGALHAFAEAVERYGAISMEEILEDAVFYADNGFPVTEVIAGEWKNAEDFLTSRNPPANPYLIDGKTPRTGQVFQNKDLAQSLKMIAREGSECFYGGEIGEAIVDFSHRNNGLLSMEDFQRHASTWVEPIRTDYRGHTVYELPPNGQGVAALEILNILEGYDFSGIEYNSPEHLHLLTEAKKIAFMDRDTLVTDPEFEPIPVEELISKEYAANRRGQIDPKRAMNVPAPISRCRGSDTVYVTAVDKERNAVSLISSIYTHFGSGVVVDGTGILLQNRGSSFSLDPEHANRIAPRKRPLHTIIPAMVFKDGNFRMSFGLMGGDMQPQGHAQFLMNLIDFKMNLQEALDAPRLRHMREKSVYLENGIPEQTARELAKLGHHVAADSSAVNEVGGGQAVYLDARQNMLFGASDRRKDGCAIGY